MQYEDRIAISTPEGIELDIALAGVGSRFTAALLDGLIQGALTLVPVLLLLPAFSGSSENIFVALYFVWWFLIIFGYDVAFETLGGGRTVGKRAVGIRVVRVGGHPVGFVTSAVRNLLRIIDFLPAAYGVGIVSILATSRNQRLGDLAAGTLVVRDESRSGRAAPQYVGPATGFHPQPPPPIEPVPAAATWDVSSVDAQELAAVRSFLERRFSLEPAARWSLSVELARRLAPKVGGAPRVGGAPSDLHPEVFLEQLYAVKASRI
jgi:uncharacterized RDD family membrane protein YckC